MLLKTTALFFLTALAEIAGCYLSLLWLRGRAPTWSLGPAALCLVLFVWLLTLHPAAAGRVYAAYGGCYIMASLVWLHLVDKVSLSAHDWVGGGVALLGMAIIVLGWKS